MISAELIRNAFGQQLEAYISPFELNVKPSYEVGRDFFKIYGESNPAFSIAYEGFQNGEDESVLDVAPETSTTADETSNVGEYDITAANGSDLNYDFSYESGALTIEKAALTITADDQIINEGDDLPDFTLSYAGFVNDDTEADITPPVTTTTAQSSNQPGIFEIVLQGGEAQNYELTLVNGTLTIEEVLGLITSEEVTIYPNPVAERFSVKSESNIQRIDIYSSNGQLIKSFNEQQEEYNIGALSNQVYLVHIIRTNSSSFVRIIKQ
jgi:hypothetical protein